MQWLIELVAEKVIAEIGVPPCYIDRGDFVGEFEDITAELNDLAWHDLDFSSVVPEGATAVVIRLKCVNNAAGAKIEMTKKDAQKGPGHCVYYTQIAGLVLSGFIVMGVDADRKIEYRGLHINWTSGVVSLRGWFL